MTPRLRSLQIGISWSTGGAGGSGRVFADLDKCLPDHGIDVIGAVAAPSDVDELTHGRVKVFAPAGAGLLARLRGARKTLRSQLTTEPVDLIASHFALFTAPILPELKRKPFVVHFHGPWAEESSEEGANSLVAALKHRLEVAVYRRADLVIVLSKAFAEVAVKGYGVPESKIRIVPGAVDLDRFQTGQTRSEARLALGWPEEKRIYVSVRRLVSRMGLDRLIVAMQSVVRTFPNTLLYLAGKGRLRKELEAQVGSLGLSDHIRFLGFVPDGQLPLIYRAADVNIVPTLALEGFGLVAAEALAAGTPSMVTPVGGLPEVVSDLSQDLIFKSTSVEDIRDALLRLEGGTLLLPDAARCQAYARERFSIDRMAAEVAAVYREACS
jgi:glycosyltransferase involved in cell wall biosynthesis